MLVDTINDTISKESENIYKKLGCPEICSPLDKLVSVKIINNKLIGGIPFCRVEVKTNTRKSEDSNSLTRVKCTRDTKQDIVSKIVQILL